MIATDIQIKILPESEIKDILPIGKEFIKEANDKFFVLDDEQFIQNWTNLYKSGVGRILIAKIDNQIIGMLGFMVYPDLLSSELIAAETFWFVTKEYRGNVGIKMLEEYEQFVKELGVKRISMAHLKNLNPEKLKTLYKSRGYREMETFFVKEVE